ncbi:MAG: hypothetical protein GY795_48720 [Desulfobacterales bacterium]|nr:hypothetical protein [Desulfobacterales bacterium]
MVIVCKDSCRNYIVFHSQGTIFFNSRPPKSVISREKKQRAEMKGEIKTYQKLMNSGIIPRELAELKIAELTKKLEDACFQFQNRAADNQAVHNTVPS